MSNNTRVGKRVLYTLNTGDAQEIIMGRTLAGRSTKRGNDPKAGQQFPGVIVADFGSSMDIPAQVERYVEIQRARYAQANGEDMGEPGYPTEFKDFTPIEFGEWLHKSVLEVEENARRSAKQASCNVQVFLDGTDTYWATSRSMFDPEQHYRTNPLQVIDGKAAEGDRIPDSEGHFVFLD